MPAQDRFHQAVVHALEKEGWTITHDPLTLRFGAESVQIDLGAERLIAAERGTEKIAVEIKTFDGSSDIYALHGALGQYLVYLVALKKLEPDRKLFLALPEDAIRRLENGRVEWCCS
jgi:XisH protein